MLVAFFPFAFTRVRTGELRACTEDYDTFRAAGTTVPPTGVGSVPAHRAKAELLERVRGLG